MILRQRLCLLAALCLLAVTPVRAETPLERIFEAEWEYQLKEQPTNASALGDRRYNDRWPDLSLTTIARRREHVEQLLARLEKLDARRLSPAERLNYDLFLRSVRNRRDDYRYRLYLLPVTQRGGLQTADQLADALRFTTVKDYEDWIARLKGFGTYTDQTIALMREGIAAGIVQPKVVMARVPAQIDAQIVDEPDKSPFYKPLRSFGTDIPEAERGRLQAAARKAIAEQVIPAFQRFKTFFVSEYLPACSAEVGVWKLPEGEALYASLARRYTTTELTPLQIHALGLKEVARIRAEMEKIREQVGFKGNLTEFFAYLRSDPRFYYTSSEELLAAYRATSKRIDPLLVKIFKKLPRSPYGVEPIPAAIAPDTTTAYYRQPAADGSRAGTYFVNLYKPEARPKYEVMALSLHESVPGHHLQIALAQELGEVPKFRRYEGYTAFIEGWGLYAESLGDDLGLYDDPYAKFGQLTYEMWRAVRLVVDTGMHALRWDRQKAIDFFLANAAKSELDVINEIDRYITNPGQALAYKVGELKIKELRARAKKSLGERFDLRDFHDVVLGAGAVPLDVLERNIDTWIASPQGRTSGK